MIMPSKNFTILSPTCTKAVLLVLIALWCTPVMGLNVVEENFVNSCTKSIEQKKLDKQNNGKADSFKDYQRYQTFNEFKMRGEGKPLRKPFVYVKRTANRIDVVTSDNVAFPKHYIRTKENIWYQHLDLEMYKINGPITKSGPDWPARTYDRVLYNDTILEYSCICIEETKFETFYIKTPKSCVMMVLLHEKDFVDKTNIISEILKMKTMFVHHKDILLKQRGQASFDKRLIEHYDIKVTPKNYIYKGVDNKKEYLFERNSLGFYGIQPGIEKYDWINSVVF